MNLSHNGLGQVGVIRLSKVIKCFPNIEEIYLEDVNMTDKSACEICNELRKIIGITKLNFSNNKEVKQNGVRQIISLLPLYDYIEYFNVEGLPLSFDDANTLVTTMKKFTSNVEILHSCIYIFNFIFNFIFNYNCN